MARRFWFGGALAAAGLALLLLDCGQTDNPPDFATFPKIDIHTHIYEDLPAWREVMDEIGLERVLNVCVRAIEPDGFYYRWQGAQNLAARYPDKFALASTFPLWNVNEPQFAEEAIAFLDESFAKGAIAVKVWKEIGMELKTADGKFYQLDDPVFDPVFAYIIQQGIPVLGHLAEPIQAFRPLDPDDPHYGYFSSHPEWHFYGKEGYPTYEEIIEARDNRVAKHPDMTFVGFHLGSMEHDVDMIAERLDRFPRMVVGTAGRLADLARQPSDKVRAFLIKYQDRVLYGTDLTISAEPGRSLPETTDEIAAFKRRTRERYYADWQYLAAPGVIKYRNRDVQALHLPRDVLEKIYYSNAKRVIRGL